MRCQVFAFYSQRGVPAEDGGEVGDGVGALVDEEVFHRITLYVGAVAPAARTVLAGQTVALGDQVDAAAADFYLGVVGVDMLAIVVGGIDEVVGVFGHVERFGLRLQGDEGGKHQKKSEGLFHFAGCFNNIR